jgi:HAMP domain-containing protein
VVAKSGGVSRELVAAISASPAREAAVHALLTKQVVDLGGMPRDYSASARALDGYGDGHALVLVCLTRATNPLIASSLLWPALGAMIVGIILVVVGAFFLDEYVSRPISEIEDGLLAIINGRTDLRFELEHAELGGLVFRLNSLLNQLFGVQEDETDEQGRPSHTPEAASFEDALAVDERMASMSGEDVSDVTPLRDEPEEAYYARLCEDYVNAKRAIGDPVDHITRENFKARIVASERELAEKRGKRVRYKVELRGKEVILVAIPLD